jgi:hypothetical protein
MYLAWIPWIVMIASRTCADVEHDEVVLLPVSAQSSIAPDT